jgi:XTP/dITP diphosphohydrolase
VLSSRFAGPNATDEENNALLLKLLHGLDDDRRRAFFFCTALFYYDEGKYCCAEGRIDGVITREPAGELGFGYDPVFWVLELGKTLAHVPAETKNGISHRAQAFRALRELIESCLC